MKHFTYFSEIKENSVIFVVSQALWSEIQDAKSSVQRRYVTCHLGIHYMLSNLAARRNDVLSGFS